MGWFALLSLIFSVIRTAVDLWPVIKEILDRIDGLRGNQKREAKAKLVEALKAHKEKSLCSTSCKSQLESLLAELAA